MYYKEIKPVNPKMFIGRTELKLVIQRIIGNFPDTEEEGHCLARKMAEKTTNTTVVRCL